MSEEIKIRAQRETDLPAIVAIRNDAKARWGTLATPYESARRWKEIQEGQAAGQVELVACAGGEAVAMAGIHRRHLARQAHVAGIGIAIRDEWQGRGVGTKLFTALTDLADHWLNIRRLELAVFCDNAGAIALYKKFGFAIEGVHVADAFRDGAFTDAYFMARLLGDLPRDESSYPPRPAPAPKADFALRAAEPADLESLTEMMNLPLVRHGTLRTPFSMPAENRHFVVPPEPGMKAVVAVVADKVVGIGVLKPGKGRLGHGAEITTLAVHDGFAGQGIGKALLEALLDIADNWLNLRKISLSAAADNAPAIGLYERFGFVAEGVKRADIFRAGRYANSLQMARLRP